MLKNVGSNWVLNGVQILVFLIISPFIVESLGKGPNGAWVTIVSLTGFLNLLILGVPVASVRFIAEHAGRGDPARMNEAISTCLGILAALGAAALGVGAALFGVLELAYLRSESWGELAAARADEIRLAYAIVVVHVSLAFVGKLPQGIFDAYRDFVPKNLVLAAGFLLKLALVIGFLSWDASLALLALVLLCTTVFEFIAALLVLKRRHPEVRFGLASFQRGLVGRVLSFSLFAMLLNVGARLAFQADALVIGKLVDDGAVTVYDIGNKIFDPLVNVVLAIAVVVMPQTTALVHEGKRDRLEDILLKWSKITLSLVLVVATYMLVLGPRFLGWWFEGEYEETSGRVLRILMASFVLYLPVRGVALPMLMGIGKPGVPAFAMLAMGVLNVALSVSLVPRYGLAGVAFGTALPNVLFAGAVLVLACRELGVSLAAYLRYVAARALPGALPAAAFLVALERTVEPEGFLALLLSGLAMLAVFGVTWVFFVHRNDRYLDLRARLSRA